MKRESALHSNRRDRKEDRALQRRDFLSPDYTDITGTYFNESGRVTRSRKVIYGWSAVMNGDEIVNPLLSLQAASRRLLAAHKKQ